MAVNHKVSYFDSIQSNIIVNNKIKIYSYSIERSGSSFLKLYFSNVRLPQYSYVEFHYGEKSIQREFFRGTDKTVIIVPGEKVNIRVVLTKKVKLDYFFSFELNGIEYDGKPLGIIGEDERRPYMCYYGTEIVEHALSSAAIQLGDWGSGSFVGNTNHVLTNRHVVISDPDLTYGEVWFNWFNLSCDPASLVSEPVRLKPGSILKMGENKSTFEDYALFTLDTFDYVNSNVKALFGGLTLSKENPYQEESIYIPQYGNNELRPMYISDMKDGDYTRILKIIPGGNEITYNADTLGGSSGSPVISRESNQVVGLHWGALTREAMAGVSAQKLNVELGSIISDSNIRVSGLGKVTSFNIEITPFDEQSSLVPVDLDKKGIILPFDTVKVKDYDSYSLVEVEVIDLITDEVFPLIFKASLISDGYQTNINNNDITGSVFLKVYDYDIDINSHELVKFWIVFKINDTIRNIRNYVIRTVISYYDVYEIPFDIDSATELYFKIRKDIELRENSLSYTIEGMDNYGFVAFYNGQGPVDLVWIERGYSEVKVFLKNISGDEVIVNLRGVRSTYCSTLTMNSSATCQASNKYSKLVLSFHPEDNKDLVFKDNDIYEGIIPLQARKRNNIDYENILINISLQGDNENSGPEEIYKTWSPDGVKYHVGEIVEYHSRNYICIQAHVSGSGNAPGVANTLWRAVS